MRNRLVRLIPLTLVLWLPALTAFPRPAMGQEAPRTFRLGTVLGLHYHTVPDAGRAMLERLWPQEVYPFADRHVPEADLVLLRCDRGARPGSYLTLWNLQSLEARNRYFPVESSPSPEMQRIDSLWMREIGYGFGGLFTESTFSGDFVLVGTIPWEEPPRFEMLGLHHFSVTEGREAEFERFLSEEFHPASRVGGLWTLLYRADRGDRSGEYVRVFAVERAEDRDRFWPPPEGQWSDELTRVMDPIMGRWEALMSFFSTRHEWSDWFVVP